MLREIFVAVVQNERQDPRRMAQNYKSSMAVADFLTFTNFM